MKRDLALLLAALGPLASVIALRPNRPEQADLLEYGLKVAPEGLTVDRMPGIGRARKYHEKFNFKVTNQTNAEYLGSAATCQLFDISVLPSTTDSTPIWQWSSEQAFCQAVTSVHIPSGKIWERTVTWTFTAAAVKDGKYKAVARFIPSGGTAVTEFVIRSVH